MSTAQTSVRPTELRCYIRKAQQNGGPSPDDAAASPNSQAASRKSVAMVISNPGLEELLSPLGFALAAALSGMDVHL